MIRDLRPVKTSEKIGTPGIKKKEVTIFTFTRSVPRPVHRRLWSSFGTELIKIGSVPAFSFLFQRENARRLFDMIFAISPEPELFLLQLCTVNRKRVCAKMTVFLLLYAEQ